MTQPPDDAALVARLRKEASRIHLRSTETRPLMIEAATALEAKDRRIAELEAFVAMVSRLTHSGDDGWFPEGDHDTLEALDALIAQARVLRGAALEPSDKGVGR